MDTALLAAALWFWRGRRRERKWERACDEDIGTLTAGEPEAIELTVMAMRPEIGRRLDYAVKNMRGRGYRLVSVVPQEAEFSWAARFERVRHRI